MLALHRRTVQQTALLPQRACPSLQPVRLWSPTVPLSSSSSSSSRRVSAAGHILRSTANDNPSSTSSSDSSSDTTKLPPPQQKQQQQDCEDAHPTGTSSTTPYPPPADSQRSAPSSSSSTTPSPKAQSGPGGISKGSRNGSSGGNPAPPEMGGGPPSNLPPQLQRLLLLLTEYGGTYGTAAVAIAWFTHVDPFGNVHWSSADVLLGLATFAPLLVLDALLMLPDYSIGPEDSQEVAGMFFGDPAALRNMSAGNISVTASTDLDATDSSSNNADPTAAAAAAAAAAASAEAPGSSGSPNRVLRLRVALELLQQVYTRANPGIGLSPVAELAVVTVAVLADEMLYRAVGLTLLGLWVRDRLYEAGFDETVSLASLGRTLDLPTPEFARYAAVALVACLGIAGFAAGALREKEALKRLQVLDKDGSPSEKADVLKAQLVASMSSQNIVMYGVEGVREVTAAIMAGVSFVATGNLAAPLAGSLAAQSLFSGYQRYSLARSKKKRKEMLGKMKARSEKLKAAMQAALTAKKAAGTAADDAAAAADAAPAADAVQANGSAEAGATADVSEADASGVAADSGSSSSGKQEDVDFLTLVLQAAEQQQEQDKQQRLKQQQQPQKSKPVATEPEAAASSSNRVGAAAAEEASTSVADWAAAAAEVGSRSDANTVSSNGSSSSNGDGSDAAAEAAKQQLSVLLEDMLRSPEGFQVVQRWLKSQNGSNSSSSASNGSSGSGISSSTDPRQAVEQLLADPEVKARLMAELQEQLCAISEVQTRRQKQQDTWRQ